MTEVVVNTDAKLWWIHKTNTLIKLARNASQSDKGIFSSVHFFTAETFRGCLAALNTTKRL